jgi:hypothetical protein
MSVLTELFISTAESAKGYDEHTADRYERVQLGGLTNLEFETLWAILDAEEWDPETHALDEIASTESAWVFQFPPRYLERLQALPDTAKPAVADAWAATDELSTTPDEFAPIIDQLITMARAAKAKGSGLYLWTST